MSDENKKKKRPSIYFDQILYQQQSRREAVAGIAAAGAALVPAAANAAAGESPRFSVFGLLGDGTAYSEGAAYGSDQSTKTYSPYSVYGESGPDSLYNKADASEYAARKKAVLAETRVRLNKLPAYLEKKKWFEITDELSRYMYETRGAVRYFSEQGNDYRKKEAAKEFFQAMERISDNARLKNQAACGAAITDTLDKLTAFEAKI